MPLAKQGAQLSLQNELIDTAVREGLPLSEILQQRGLGYDDLIYETSHELQWRGKRPPLLDELRATVGGVPVVSFFTGCGGMDLGLEAVGYKHVAAFEFNELFCRTLRTNRPKWNVFGPPIHIPLRSVRAKSPAE